MPSQPASPGRAHRLHAGHVWTRHPGEPLPISSGSKIIDALDPRDNRVTGDPFGNVPPRYNGAPSQQLWVIRQNPQTGVVVFPLRLDADRAAREADLTRSGLACASDCFLPIWQSASAESFAPYRVAGTMREFMD